MRGFAGLVLIAVLCAAAAPRAAADVRRDALEAALLGVERHNDSSGPARYLTLVTRGVTVDRTALRVVLGYCTRDDLGSRCVEGRNEVRDVFTVPLAAIARSQVRSRTLKRDAWPDDEVLHIACGSEEDCVEIAGGESVTRIGTLALKCRDAGSCARAAGALLAILDDPGSLGPGPGPAADGVPQAGMWRPADDGAGRKPRPWQLELRADGSYSFTDLATGARHDGLFVMQKGQWRLRGRWTDRSGLPADTPPVFAEIGRYAWTGPGRLRLGGSFGAIDWARAE